MNGKLQVTTWATFVAFVTLIAANGQAFFDALNGVPSLVAAYTAMLPLGTGSLLLSIAFASGAYVFIERWAPEQWTPRRRDFVAECFSLVACIGLTVLQVTLASDKASPRDLLVAMVLGAVGGWIAPWLAKAVMAPFKQRNCP